MSEREKIMREQLKGYCRNDEYKIVDVDFWEGRIAIERGEFGEVSKIDPGISFVGHLIIHNVKAFGKLLKVVGTVDYPSTLSFTVWGPVR